MPTSIYESVKKALQDIVAPELRAIEGKFEAVRAEIKRLDEKIDGLDKRIDSVDKRIDSLRSEFSVRFESLEREISRAIDIHERLAALEAKIGH